MRKVFHILLFIFCLSATCWSKGKCIYGVVTNSAGVPLDVVSVENVQKGVGTFTDSQGAFSVQMIPDSVDSISLDFSLIGYADQTIPVSFPEDSTFIRVVMKEKEDLIQSVDVVGHVKQETTIERLNVDVTKIITNASGDGIISVVTTQPGVSSVNELSSQYSVRGGNYDENCVYVNSIEIYRPLLIRNGQQEGLSFVNSDMVESVSFSSGGFSPEYGDKMSSVLDIKYKTPSSFEGAVSLSFLGGSAYVGTSNPKFSQLHGFRYKSSSYLLNSLETEGEYNPKFLDYQTYMNYRFSQKWSLSFLGNISRNQYNFIPKSRDTNFGTMYEMKQVHFSFDGQEDDLFSTYFGAFTLKFKPSSCLTLELIGSSFLSIERVAYDISSVYSIGSLDPNAMVSDLSEGFGAFHEHSRNSFDGTVTNISHIGTIDRKNNQVKWGLSVQIEDLSEKVIEWELRDSAGYSQPLNPDRMSLYENLDADVSVVCHRLSGFLQDAYTIRSSSGRLVLLGGLRFSYWDFNEQLTLSPRASLAWFPANSNWGFRVATGIYHQALLFKEVKKSVVEDGNYSYVLNHDIKSPRSAQIILATDYYFRKWGRPFKLTGELYYKYIDRIIPYQVDNMKITYLGENFADGFAFGGDVKLFGEFVPGTDSWVSLSLMNTKENIYGDGLGYLPRPTDQRFNISMFFQDYLPGFEKLKFNIKLVWSDGFPFCPPNTIGNSYDFRMSNYKRVDLGVAYHLRRGVDPFMSKKFFSWMKSLSLNMDVFNVLDLKNVNSNYWVPVSNGQQYAVPNYLTGRLFNLKLAIEF